MGSLALPEEVTVLIVGGGPVGLLASILLSGQGVDNLVLERREGPQSAPAAHVVNARTFEIMRAGGVDMERVSRACRPPSDGWVRWVHSLVGDQVGCVPFEGQNRIGDLDQVTPTPLRNLSQHLLEPILRDQVAGLAGGQEWIGAEEISGGIASAFRDTRTGVIRTVRSRYVIGADGAGSPVRRAVGVAMEGPPRLESILAIEVAADLRHLVADRPATLYWLTDPDHRGTYLAHDIDSTWVYMHRWDPDKESIDDYTPQRCEALFRRGIGTDAGPIAVRSVTPWNMSCQVAERYRCGRIFLAGDAAHRFPPTGGLGLNTGAVDAQNLVWKLAAVVHGWAAESILDSYEAERRPVAQTNADQSLRNAVKLFDVWTALGADPDPSVDRTNYEAIVSSPDGRKQAARAVDEQAEHFDMIGLQLGFSYGGPGSLVIDDGSPVESPDDVVRDYLPSTRPGGRLPHAWIYRDGHRLSTLDLIGLGRFALITSSAEWASAGRVLEGEGFPLNVVLIGDDVLDRDSSWQRTAGLGSRGAIVVRPDQHVAWRGFDPDSDDRADALRRVLRHLSGRIGPGE